MENLRKKIIEIVLAEGYNITAEAINILERLDNPIEKLKKTIEKLRREMPSVLVIGSEHLVYNEPGERILEGVSETEVEEKEVTAEWSPRIEVDERFQKQYRIRGEASEFQNYFKSRYMKLKRILEERGERYIRIADLMKAPRNSEAFLIVMLLDKKDYQNSIILMVEDDSGQTRLIISKKDTELLKKAEKVLPDQVFGVRVTKINNTFLVKDLFLPDVPLKHKTIEKYLRDVYVVLLSDLHIGSKKFRKDYFESFLDWINRSRDSEVKKIKYIVIAGDLVDGVGVFPRQEDELEYNSINQQIEEAGKILSEIPREMKILISAGNHEPVSKAIPQPPLPLEYRKILDKNGEYIFIGNPCYVKLEDRLLLVYHGQSLDDMIQYLPNISYTTLSRDIGVLLEMILKYRHLTPIYGENTSILPTPEDLLVIDEIPDIIHTGHVHVAYAGGYREVLLVNSGTWQDQTSFQREIGLEPTVGTAILINLKTLTVRLKKFS